jgi:hypothetical protein
MFYNLLLKQNMSIEVFAEQDLSYKFITSNAERFSGSQDYPDRSF